MIQHEHPHTEPNHEDTDDDRDELDLIGNTSASAECEDIPLEPTHTSTESQESAGKDTATGNNDTNSEHPPSSQQHASPPPPRRTPSPSLVHTTPIQETVSRGASHDEQMQVDGNAAISSEADDQSSKISAQSKPKESSSTQTPSSPETVLIRGQIERVYLKATPTDIGISPSLLATPKAMITIPAPIEPSLSVDQFSVTVTPLPDQVLTLDPATPQQIAKAQYTLPPAHILPPEFSRKKASKRKKDRSERKDDLPMGLNRWAATLNANPVYTRLKRATKCLSSREWSVSMMP